jgi:hypothetical protein
LDWYCDKEPFEAQLPSYHYWFQSPDGDSLDWYGFKPADHYGYKRQEQQSFSPLTGIHWIGTITDQDTAEDTLQLLLKFQSPDGDSLDWYSLTRRRPPTSSQVSVP